MFQSQAAWRKPKTFPDEKEARVSALGEHGQHIWSIAERIAARIDFTARARCEMPSGETMRLPQVAIRSISV
jgi:hypothetical protein